jgi:NADH-ubiquinone reductase complex 1 MLRQ subunit
MCTKFLTYGKQDTFQKNWLSDPSTYPVMAALTFGIFMCAGVGFSCLVYSPDVRIATDKKHATVRDWGL